MLTMTALATLVALSSTVALAIAPFLEGSGAIDRWRK